MTYFSGVDIDAIHRKIKAILITNIKNKTGSISPMVDGTDKTIDDLVVLAESVGLNVQVSVIDTDLDDDGRC
jgi:hypothetical protein